MIYVTRTRLETLCKSFSNIRPSAVLFTRVAVSWVFPPTRILIRPVRCCRFAIKFKKGTWRKELTPPNTTDVNKRWNFTMNSRHTHSSPLTFQKTGLAQAKLSDKPATHKLDWRRTFLLKNQRKTHSDVLRHHWAQCYWSAAQNLSETQTRLVVRVHWE